MRKKPLSSRPAATHPQSFSNYNRSVWCQLVFARDRPSLARHLHDIAGRARSQHLKLASSPNCFRLSLLAHTQQLKTKKCRTFNGKASAPRCTRASCSMWASCRCGRARGGQCKLKRLAKPLSPPSPPPPPSARPRHAHAQHLPDVDRVATRPARAHLAALMFSF